MSDYKHDNRTEDIRCAAIWFDDKEVHPHQPVNIKSGYVVCGLRHCNCYVIAFMANPNWKGKIRPLEGFLTSKNHFIGREYAVDLAYESGQVGEDMLGEGQLFSEDLY